MRAFFLASRRDSHPSNALSVRSPAWNVIKPSLNFLIAIFISYCLARSFALERVLPSRVPQRFLMSEFNAALMTSSLPLRDLLSIAQFPGVHPR